MYLFFHLPNIATFGTFGNNMDDRATGAMVADTAALAATVCQVIHSSSTPIARKSLAGGLDGRTVYLLEDFENVLASRSVLCRRYSFYIGTMTTPAHEDDRRLKRGAEPIEQ